MDIIYQFISYINHLSIVWNIMFRWTMLQDETRLYEIIIS